MTRTAPKPRAVIGSNWAVRKIVYALTLAAGVIAVAFFGIDQATADSWTGYVSDIANGATMILALLGGGLATVNTGPESDDNPTNFQPPAQPPAPEEPSLPVYDGSTTTDGLNPFAETGGRHRATE